MWLPTKNKLNEEAEKMEIPTYRRLQYQAKGFSVFVADSELHEHHVTFSCGAGDKRELGLQDLMAGAARGLA